jgi:hypothetical protein
MACYGNSFTFTYFFFLLLRSTLTSLGLSLSPRGVARMWYLKVFRNHFRKSKSALCNSPFLIQMHFPILIRFCIGDLRAFSPLQLRCFKVILSLTRLDLTTQSVKLVTIRLICLLPSPHIVVESTIT